MDGLGNLSSGLLDKSCGGGESDRPIPYPVPRGETSQLLRASELLSEEEGSPEDEDALAGQVGRKRPRRLVYDVADIDSGEDEEEKEEKAENYGVPDLGGFFDSYPNVTPEGRITMCRSYASYVSSALRVSKQ